ncbi:hypothetical protein FMO003_19860 [Moritella sp. F3]|nr:hypothetical protein FMO001_12690 [Moritella sp. F1]GIC81705.1 hypothetical protein FMO003_19860 [Moritella sp. F3]
MEERLALRWQTLLTQHFTSLSLAEVQQSWSRLLPHYQETHRYYHDLHHIDACFIWFDQVQATLDNPLAVALAIWFHDIIYDVRRSDNEEKSAQYAVTALTNLAVSTALVQQVYELILLTRHPSKPSHVLTGLVSEHDQALFLDIDLSVLGQCDAIYANYEKAIRAEYQHIPLWLYKLGRKRLLRQFLRQSSIYYSDYFNEKFELQARVNIQSVLKP